MDLYYFVPYIVMLAVGAILVYFVTKTVNYPNATLQNAFILSAVWIALIVASGMFVNQAPALVILELALYLLAINSIYNPKPKQLFILFALSIIFRIAAGLTISKFVTGAIWSSLI